MLTLKLQYVRRRGDGYKYRRVVPADVRGKINDGKDNWIRSWRPGTPLAQVEREAKQLAALHDQAIAAARGQSLIVDAESVAQFVLADGPLGTLVHRDLVEQGEEDFGLRRDPKTAAIIRAIEGGGRYIPESMRLSEALVHDRNLYSGDKDARPFKYAVESFIELIGDKDVTQILRADVSAWLAAQRKRGLAPATIRRRFGTLKALVNRTLLDLESDKRNPFDGHKVGGKGSPTNRLPLNREMLALLDAYLATGSAGPETVNILRMMKCTGMGPAEVGGLVVADMSLDGEIPYVWVRHNALRRIKEEVRDRQVPLLADALTAAVVALEDAKERTKGESRDTAGIFPSFNLSGRGADSISAKLNKAIRKAGVPKSRRLTAYSLRHTIKDALRSAGVHDHLQRRLLGHSGEGVADDYGSAQARLEKLAEALEKALEHLGDVDPLNYSEHELSSVAK